MSSWRRVNSLIYQEGNINRFDIYVDVLHIDILYSYSSLTFSPPLYTAAFKCTCLVAFTRMNHFNPVKYC